eukprot:m.1631 g.1631  ORF g.1631 m.1631 type:complete len:61 (+) comp1122_c0_seq1:54-236(+)
MVCRSPGNQDREKKTPLFQYGVHSLSNRDTRHPAAAPYSVTAFGNGRTRTTTSTTATVVS